jgi:hypothetical protein
MRYYLNGIDWMVQGLHYNCRRSRGGDYQFLIVLRLSGTPDVEKLENCFRQTVELFPVLSGRLRRHLLNLAPYWNPHKARSKASFTMIQCTDETGCQTQQELFLNEPFKPKAPLVSARLFALADGSSQFACKFDHMLFDADGGERFIGLLNKMWNNEAIEPEKYLKQEGPWLNEWSHQFECGRTVNRTLAEVFRQGTPSVFYAKGYKPGANRFKVVRLEPEQFNKLRAAAEATAGPMMLTPYLIAVLQNALHRIFERRGEPDSLCLCPMTVNLRAGNEDKLFFNHWSIMPMYSHAAKGGLLSEAVSHQKDLFYEYTKNRFPYCFTKANLLTRIVPLPLTALITANPFRRTAGTATLAMLSQATFKASEAFGQPVVDLFHVPRIPPRPGVGIFMNQHNGSCNITISWLDGTISADELNIIAGSIYACAHNSEA